MALISCPNCGKEVSDKAEFCVQCGFVLKIKPSSKRICSECGMALDDNNNICPNCGCPYEEHTKDRSPQKVEVTNVNLTIDKKKKKKITTTIIAAVIIIVLAFGVTIIKEQEAISNYHEQLVDCSNTMIVGAAKAESLGGLVHDVWANTIFEEDDIKTDEYTKNEYGVFNEDFNTSLMNLMNNKGFQNDIENLIDNQERVQSMMKDLKNPPSEYEEAYDAIKELYDAYSRLVDCAIDPSGNLQSYTEKFNQADSDASNCYKAMSLYLED